MKKKKNIFLVITVLLIGIGFLARLFLIWTSGESFHRVLALMLDDGYFGAGIARNFVNGHGVSFNAATAVFAATAFYYLGEKMSPKRYKHVMPLIAAGIFLFYSTLVFVQDGIAYRWVSGTPERLVLQGFTIRDQFPDDHNNWGGCSVGAIGYFSMKLFNNVEGKVNNVAFQYLKKKELEKYIRKVNIKYIVNYEELLPYVQFMQENIIASGRKDVNVNKYNKSVPISLLHVPYNDH